MFAEDRSLRQVTVDFTAPYNSTLATLHYIITARSWRVVIWFVVVSLANTTRSVIIIHPRVYVCVCGCGKTWNDYRLTWNASNFAGLEHVYLSTADLWIPDATLYNTSDYLSSLYYT